MTNVVRTQHRGYAVTIRYSATEVMRAAHVTSDYPQVREFGVYMSTPGGRPWMLWRGDRVNIDTPEKFGRWETASDWREWVRRFATA